MIKISKEKTCIILGYLLMLFFLIFNYGSYGLFLGKYSKEITFFAPFAVACIFIFALAINRKTIQGASFAILIGLICNILLSVVLASDTAVDNYILILVLLTAYFIARVISADRLVELYLNVMEFLAIYSLIASYVFLPLSQIGVLRGIPIYVNADRQFLDMMFAMCLNWFGLARNCGFCREPGVYQVFLVIALFLTIEREPCSKRNMRQILIFLITLLTTFSAIAYVALAVSIVLFLKKYSLFSRKTAKGFAIALIFLVASAFYLLQNEAVVGELVRTFGKWSGENSNSLSVRFSGIVGNISLFLESPIWGHGMVNAMLDAKSRFGFEDITGTMFLCFSSFGCVFGIIQNMLLWKACKTRNVGTHITWFIVILLSVSSQNLMLSYMFWAFLFLPVVNRGDLGAEKN